MRCREAWIVVAFAVVAGACGDGDDPPVQVFPRGYDARAYTLRARFDWAQRKLIASQDITLVLVAGASPMVELDATVQVDSVSAGGADLPFTVDAARGLLRVDLTAVVPGDRATPITFTVEYQAATSGALTATSGRDADPVTSRVVYTDSEPDRGKAWLVASHRPDDRAEFAVELTVAGNEDVIANGARVLDQTNAAGRVIGYRMEDPIPTYLMAFAAGELDHKDRDRASGAPLSLWYRRGLTVEADRHLDLIEEAMTRLEALLGPYPFERYSTVLVPLLGGGMENAGITFNAETSGQGNISFGLNAHELGHQWFGDWVTIDSFDDLWIKEGMATLLAAEAARGRRDAEGKGRLFGFAFGFNRNHAIQDLSLPLLERYTSGPYERAAWLLTQIRAEIGEAAFWQKLRDILDDHALGSIDSETFLRGFAPALDEAGIAWALAVLDEKRVPQLTVDTTPVDGGGARMSFLVDDPGATLLVPIEVTVVDGNGIASVRPLAAGRVEVVVPADGYLAVDERDVHPNWPSGFVVSNADYFDELAPRFVPSSDPEALAAFGSRSASAQERALWPGVAPLAAERLPAFYAALDSSTARFYTEIAACRRLRSAGAGAGAAAWIAALDPILRAPGLLTITSSYAACGTTLAQQLFAGELAALAADPGSSRGGRIGYVMSFDHGAGTFAALSRIATDAPSMQMREQAIELLGVRTGSAGYSPIPAEQLPSWKSFFRDRLAEATSGTRVDIVWAAIVELADDTALAAAGAALQRVPMSAGLQRVVVCDARTLSEARAGAWDEFAAAAQPWERLSSQAQAALRDPAGCAN